MTIKQNLVAQLHWELFAEQWAGIAHALSLQWAWQRAESEYKTLKRRYIHAGRPRGYKMPKPVDNPHE
jgi:hypothetical protein